MRPFSMHIKSKFIKYKKSKIVRINDGTSSRFNQLGILKGRLTLADRPYIVWFLEDGEIIERYYKKGDFIIKNIL